MFANQKSKVPGRPEGLHNGVVQLMHEGHKFLDSISALPLEKLVVWNTGQGKVPIGIQD
jgi:hypothetical protein